VDKPIHEAACTCWVRGECDTCKRWHAKITEIIERQRALTRPREERLD